MKPKFYLSWLASLLLISCSTSTDEITDPSVTPPQGKEFSIRIGHKGEISEDSTTPLLKANNVDVYGIQVYAKEINKPYSSYRYYATGIFNDLAQMKLILQEGYLYKFESSMVPDGMNILRHSDTEFYDPFYMNNAYGKFENQFQISSSNYLSSFNKGEALLANSDRYMRSHTDRYHGILSDYEPIENGVVNIPMKRTVFGAKFIANNLAEGKLIISLENAKSLEILADDTTEVEQVFSFADVRAASEDDNYTENIPVTVFLEKNGVKTPILNKTIAFKRKTLHTFQINIIEGNNNQVGVDLEDPELSIQPEDNLNGTEGGIETPVEPTP